MFFPAELKRDRSIAPEAESREQFEAGVLKRRNLGALSLTWAFINIVVGGETTPLTTYLQQRSSKVAP